MGDCIKIRKEKLLGKKVDNNSSKKSPSISITELEKIKQHVNVILPEEKFEEFDGPIDNDKKKLHEAEQRLE